MTSSILMRASRNNAAAYTLVGDGSIPHVVNAHRWLDLGAPPRTRCQERVGERWKVVASTDSRAQIAKTDCCPECRKALVGTSKEQ